MNGRIYDPATAHFLSPDNFVQNPGSTQSFHRYGYCFNNPLKYKDPSGNKLQWADLLGIIDPVYFLYRAIGDDPDKSWKGTPSYFFAYYLPYNYNPAYRTLYDKIKGTPSDKPSDPTGKLYYEVPYNAYEAPKYSEYEEDLSTNEGLTEFMNYYFQEFFGYTDENVTIMWDDNFQYTGDNMPGTKNRVNGHTISESGYYEAGDATIIYINPDLRNDPMQLYITVGHELIHSYQITSGLYAKWKKDYPKDYNSIAETYAYDFSMTLAERSFGSKDIITINQQSMFDKSYNRLPSGYDIWE